MKLFLKYHYAIFMCLFFSLFSCKNFTEKDALKKQKTAGNSLIKYAKGFDIQVFDDYKKLIIKTPYPNAGYQQEILLYKADEKKNKAWSQKVLLPVPLKKIVATSTTHIPMLELIGEETSLIGFPNTDYIVSSKTRELIKNGAVTEIGSNQSINTEILISLQPQAVIGFTMGNTTKMYKTIERNGIPVIYNGDWLEETPLGRAEWIKFFGALYDKDAIADSIFNDIETKYLHAKSIAKNAKNMPTIFTGILYKDKWNLPAGESFIAQLYKDANVDYLWKESKGQGSLVLGFEAVFEKAQMADYWIGSGYFTHREELGKANMHYKEFASYKNDHIYTFAKKRGENGGLLYFEFAAIQPHIVLQDLIKVTHPELLPDYQPYFLEKLNE